MNRFFFKYKRLHDLYKSKWGSEYVDGLYRFNITAANGNRYSYESRPSGNVFEDARRVGYNIKEFMDYLCLAESYTHLKHLLAIELVSKMNKQERKLLKRHLNEYD